MNASCSAVSESLSDCPLRVAVLFSGRGSNLAALIRLQAAGNYRVALALTNNRTAGGTEICSDSSTPCVVIDDGGKYNSRYFESTALELIESEGIDLVVLAGFMRILTHSCVVQLQNRMINIHPSLLPQFPGLNTHERALQSAVTVHGCSVHLVIPELDAGAVIAQSRLRVSATDNVESLSSRVLADEHQLLPAVVSEIAAGRICFRNNRIYVNEQELKKPMQLDGGALVMADHDATAGD